MDYINSHTTSLSTNLKLDPESRSRTVRPTKGGGGGREGWNMWVILYSHSQPTLNQILSPDPDPEQSGLLKGGGVGERGGTCGLYCTLSLSTNLKPDPESRAPPENIVLCRNKTEKCLNIRISKDQ